MQRLDNLSHKTYLLRGIVRGPWGRSVIRRANCNMVAYPVTIFLRKILKEHNYQDKATIKLHTILSRKEVSFIKGG